MEVYTMISRYFKNPKLLLLVCIMAFVTVSLFFAQTSQGLDTIQAVKPELSLMKEEIPQTTHVGQKASKLVSLIILCDQTWVSTPKRVSSDGYYDINSTFSVPSGNVFILTDVEWTYSGEPNKDRIFGITVESTARSGYSNILTMNMRLDNTGRGRCTEHFTTGIPISSKTKILPNIVWKKRGDGGKILLRGYLAPDV
jgi:hypothetical protein